MASLVGSGATDAEIASALYISVGTTRNHVSKVLRKLSLRDRTQLAIFAVERGWSQRRQCCPNRNGRGISAAPALRFRQCFGEDR